MSMSNESKTIGVIGGMGPAATQLFYRMVIENTQAEKDQDHVNMIILNHATVPDRTEYLLDGRRSELLDVLLSDAKMLENNGAAAIVIPCNTSHALADDIQEQIGIPILNMIRNATDDIRVLFPDPAEEVKYAILATDGTVQTGLYQTELKKRGIQPFLPSAENQERVMKIIYEGVKGGGIIDYADFAAVEEELTDAGCKGAIMACTEMSCFKEICDLSDFYFDAMLALAKRAITFAGKELK